MKLNKFFGVVISAAMAIFAMAMSVSAVDSVDVKLYAQDTSVWELCESSSATTITGDGSYSISADLKGYDLFATLYIKDVTGNKAPAGLENAVFTVDSIVLNGSVKLDMSKTEFDLVGEQGIVDICFVNQWADTFVNNVELNGGSYNYLDGGKVVAVNDVTVNFTVSGLGGAGGLADDGAGADETPASDSNTVSATTGNTAAIAIVSVMALAGLATVATKKRK